MTDLHCFRVFVDEDKEPLYCVGTGLDDIAQDLYETVSEIRTTEYLGKAWVTHKAQKVLEE
jgi:hypothetical protein